MSKIDEGNVREQSGVYGCAHSADKRWITILEYDEIIQVSIDNYRSYVTPDAARCLARQLYRVARRVEARLG